MFLNDFKELYSALMDDEEFVKSIEENLKAKLLFKNLPKLFDVYEKTRKLSDNYNIDSLYNKAVRLDNVDVLYNEDRIGSLLYLIKEVDKAVQKLEFKDLLTKN